MGCPIQRHGKRACPRDPRSALLPERSYYLPLRSQFLQFRMKIINLKLERFGDRVEFSGNPSKYDVSVTLKDVQLEDEGIYNCYITNPPDRHRGHGKIYLQVLLEGKSDWAAVRHSPFSTA